MFPTFFNDYFAVGFMGRNRDTGIFGRDVRSANQDVYQSLILRKNACMKLNKHSSELFMCYIS